ncbi:MAG: MFS transporter [Acidobacteria bacterium]|nr:MFS transporter [Acidobacteriota bacterium]
MNSPAARSLFVFPRGVAFATTAVTLAALYLAAGAPTPLLVVYQRRWDFPEWQLTVAFAVYAVALLIALLVVGSLSDFVGRRVVVAAALALESGAMVLFLLAPSVGWLIAARAVQGLATGAATTAMSAALLDLAPDARKGLAGVINGIAPAGGLGVGALLAGIAAQLSARPDTVVFAVLVAVMLAAAGAALLVPDEVQRSRGALASLLPHASVPPTARAAFAASIPLQVAAWMLAGLFMGLIPTILATILGVHSGITDGFTAFLEPGTAALAGALLGRTGPRSTVLVGGAGVLVGAVIITIGIATAWLPLLWIGGLIGGVGFGASFSGTLRTLAPLVAPAQRAELFASVYIVAYLSFGVPVIAAGQLIAPVGLLPVVTVYAAAVAALAAAGMVAQLQQRRLARSRAAEDTNPRGAPPRADQAKEWTS